MHSTAENPPRRARAIVLSVALHGSVFAAALFLGIHSTIKLVQPEHFVTVAQLDLAGGSHAVKLQLPQMDTSAHTRHPAPNTEATPKTILPVEQPHPSKVSGGGAPPSPHAGNGSGQAPIGNGSDAADAHPAFPVFSPRPPVSDRALLPASEQKIVVDVNVDALGAVVSETLVRGLGNQLDQIVLDTVKSWRFQPATVDGKPVPTEAELIFPFNPSYPIAAS